MADYEPCLRCQSWRAKGEYKRALSCSFCKGRGLVATPEAHLCNACGMSLHTSKDRDCVNSQIPSGALKISFQGDYESTGLHDLHKYELSLCEMCLRTIMAKCVLPPKVWQISFRSGNPTEEPVSFAEDQEAFEYHQWCDNLGHANARLHGICNQTRTCGKPALWSRVRDGLVTDDCSCESHKENLEWEVSANIVPFVPYLHKSQSYSIQRSMGTVVLFSPDEEGNVDQVARVVSELRGGADHALLLFTSEPAPVTCPILLLDRYATIKDSLESEEDLGWPMLISPGKNEAVLVAWLRAVCQDMARTEKALHVQTIPGWK